MGNDFGPWSFLFLPAGKTDGRAISYVQTEIGSGALSDEDLGLFATAFEQDEIGGVFAALL